jgi:hypothetical protein
LGRLRHTNFALSRAAMISAPIDDDADNY